MQLHVAGALELLVDDFVHPRAGVDQRRGDDRQRAAFLEVPRGAEEPLRPLQRVRVEAAGEDLSGGGLHVVVGAGEAGDRVEQDHDVLAVLDHPLRLLDHHLGHGDVARRRLVERRGDDLAVHRALDVGHLFRPLVDQQHDEVGLLVVGEDRVGQRLEERRLAGPRGGDDQAALPLAQRREHVHHAAGQVVLGRLEPQLLHRVERREVLEEDPLARLVGVVVVDRLDLDQREVPLVLLRVADLPRDRVPGEEREAVDLRRGDVDVVGAGEVAVLGGAEEAVALRQDLERSFGEDEPLALRLGAQDLEDQVLLPQPGHSRQPHLAGRARHLLDPHAGQAVERERVARLAGAVAVDRAFRHQRAFRGESAIRIF